MNQIQKWDVVVALIRESAQGSKADDPQFVTNSETIIRLCKEDMHFPSAMLMFMGATIAVDVECLQLVLKSALLFQSRVEEIGTLLTATAGETLQ